MNKFFNLLWVLTADFVIDDAVGNSCQMTQVTPSMTSNLRPKKPKNKLNGLTRIPMTREALKNQLFEVLPTSLNTQSMPANARLRRRFKATFSQKCNTHSWQWFSSKASTIRSKSLHSLISCNHKAFTKQLSPHCWKPNYFKCKQRYQLFARQSQ